MNTAAIANHLNVAESAITEIQEWARVLWVRVKGLGARFVSKKVGVMESKILNRIEAAQRVADLCSNKYGFGRCSVWSKKEGELRVYLGKNGYVEVIDTVSLYCLKAYKKEVAALLSGLVGCKLRQEEAITTTQDQKCWRDEDGNPVDEIAHPAEAVYYA